MGPTEEERLEELEKALEDLHSKDQVTVNDDGTKTVKLTEAVTYSRGEKVVSEVTFRKPRGFDYREMGKGKNDTDQGFYLAASLSGLPLSVFDNMLGDDALLCVTVAGSMAVKK